MGHTVDSAISVRIDGDGAHAFIAIDGECPAAALDAAALVALLEARGVRRFAIDEDAIREAIADFARAPRDLSFTAARGTPARDGEDGAFLPDPDLAAALDRAAAVRRRTSPPPATPDADDPRELSAFVIVRAGQRLGTLTPPTDGEDGVDILGNALPSRAGRPCSMAVDDSLAVDAQGHVNARIGGELRRVGSLLTVSPELEVHGDVGFATGNVRFPADVRVRGGVSDLFTVEAGGNLVVLESIDAASIIVAGDADLRGGMAGRDKGRVEIRGSLAARYLDSVLGNVARDCTVEREIYGCTLTIGGAVTSPNAAVKGGRLTVAGRCEIACLGGEGGVTTELVLGGLPELDDTISEADILLQQLERDRTAAQERLDSLKRNIGRLTASQAEELTSLEWDYASSERRVRRLRDGLDNARQVRGDNPDPELVLRRSLHRGARIVIGGWRIELAADVEGVMRLVLDDGRPRLLSQISGDTIPLSPIATVTPPDRRDRNAA